MVIKSSERRMAENEVVFRKYNESLTEGFRYLKNAAKESNHEADAPDITEPLQFFCECSDENCIDRVPITIPSYELIHKKRNRFIIKKGHEAVAIEKVVNIEKNYAIVDKFITPPEDVDSLQPTTFSNA